MIEVRFYKVVNEEALTGLLSHVPFQSVYSPMPGCLALFIDDAQWNAETMRSWFMHAAVSSLYHNYIYGVCPNQNWNAEWESSFQPLVIHNVALYAPFHNPPDAPISLMIEPGMAFGTGHHPTTALMIEAMQSINYRNLRVLDMGCGTGVLALLAKKMKAGFVLGVDHEEVAIASARTNALRNGMRGVVFRKANVMPRLQFHQILANITLNPILNYLPELKRALLPEGSILFSGILSHQQEVLEHALSQQQMVCTDIFEEDDWLAVAAQHK